MALLHMANKRFKYIEVAHVNYHKRKSALRDEKIVRRYCKENGIKLHVLNVDPNKVKGNFQAYAREKRYMFFSKLCKKYNLDCVLIAHHKDDLIETYLMQMEKNMGVSHYGLASEITLYDTKILRPLLSFTKDELTDYCNLNSIEYGIDESNLTNHYKRNQIRHNKIEHMSDKDKDKIIKEINNKNKQLTSIENKALSFIGKKNKFTVNEFISYKYIKNVLRILFGDESDNFYEEMLRQLKTCDKYLYIGDLYCISKEYSYIYIFLKPLDYSFTFNNMKQINSKDYLYFRISKKGTSKDAVTITSNDFPLTIRNVRKNDSIAMRYGTKKINRFFIDNKVLVKDRLSWPIVINKKGIAILVPGIGCNVGHYSLKPNLYVIKL